MIYDSVLALHTALQSNLCSIIQCMDVGHTTLAIELRCKTISWECIALTGTTSVLRKMCV